MQNNRIIQVEDKVPPRLLVPLSIQHMFAMFGASVLVPFIFKMNPAIVLFMNGIGTLLFILSYQSISVLIVSLLANLRLSLSIGGGYSVLAFTFSGLTFPIMAMWEPMQWVSKIFPFTFYTDIFVDQMLRGTPWVYSLPDLGYMMLFIVLPLLCLPRLKRVCTEEKFWGRL